MGVQPSKTELLLPSQTLRECHPDRCWCDRPYHRSSRYVYVERGGDGRERYQDPVDIMSQFMTGGAGSTQQMPWKDPRSWTVRDYEKLSEVMEEWALRENGKSSGNSGGRGGGFPNWPGMQQQQGSGGGHWDGDEYGGGRHSGGSSGRRSRRYVPWEQFEDLKSNMQHMAEQYQRYMSEQDAFLFGSDTDRRKEQYRQNMLNQFKEMMPQLVQIMSGGGGQQQQGMPGMPQQQQMSGFPAMPGMSMPGMQMPGQPMMQNPMQAMNGMAGVSPMAAAAAMQSMNGGMPPQMMNPMNGAGMMPGMGGMEAAQNMGRRARRRNGFALDDGFDEDYDDFRPRRGFSKRRGGGGGNWRDDDDMLGGLAGNGMHGPRGPTGGPPRPPTFRPGGGGDFSGGGMAFEDTYQFRPTNVSPGYGGSGGGNPATRPQHDTFSSYGAGAARTRFSPPLRRPNYNAADVAATAEMRQQQNMMHGSDPLYSASSYGMSQAGHDPNLYSSDIGLKSSSAGSAPYTSAATGATAGPSNLRSAMKRNVGFEDVSTETAHLSRPREEETARGEANAGALPDRRDGLGTL